VLEIEDKEVSQQATPNRPEHLLCMFSGHIKFCHH